MLNSNELFALHKTGLKYHICRIRQEADGLRFTVKMEHEMAPEKKSEGLENSQTQHEVVQLRTITGGRDGGVNWLASLPINTVFLCKDKKQGCILTQFHVVSKYKKSALLMSNYPGPDFRVFVETVGFSGENELIEIMKEGDDGGNSHSDEAGLDQS